MDIFHQIAIKIIKEQEDIIGKLAWSEINNIPGIVLVDLEAGIIELKGSKQEAINNLVAHFNRLFGKASYEVSRASVEDLLKKIAPTEIPASLREEKVAIEKITEELYKRNVELASKNEMLVKLQKQLEEKNSKLKQLDEAKDDFINIASHQLKSPVAIIQSSLEIAEQQKAYDSELFSTSRKQIEKLNRIVSEILLASKLTTKKYQAENLERINIVELVQSIINEQTQLSKSKLKIMLNTTLASDFAIYGDQLYITEAFTNIISNAIKYTAGEKGDGSVDVTLSCDLTAQTFIFVCRDNGMGMAKEDLARVFNKFERAKNASSVASGSGLGMFITKEIIEGHKGNIKVESELGLGTVVRIEIPMTVEEN